MQFPSDAHQLEKGKSYLFIFMLIIFFLSLKANAQFNGETPYHEDVSLTCTFGENIDENSLPFRILDDQSDNVLKCTWEKGKLFCSVGDGYSFDWRISDKVTVMKSQGPKPSICFCFLVDQDNTKYERPCSVGGPVERPESEKIEAQNPELDEHFSPKKSLSEELLQTDQQSKSDNAFVIVVVALIVVSVGLFGAVIFILIKWRRRESHYKTKTVLNIDSLLAETSKESV